MPRTVKPSCILLGLCHVESRMVLYLGAVGFGKTAQIWSMALQLIGICRANKRTPWGKFLRPPRVLTANIKIVHRVGLDEDG
jgi:hypothetical protein